MRVGINVQRCAVAPPMWRRANERRRRAMSPMTSVAARGPGRQRRRRRGMTSPMTSVAARGGAATARRERATISECRGGLVAASLSQRRRAATGRRRRQRGRATRRAGVNVRRCCSGGARRVVAEYQCLCSEKSVECYHTQY